MAKYLFDEKRYYIEYIQSDGVKVHITFNYIKDLGKGTDKVTFYTNDRYNDVNKYEDGRRSQYWDGRYGVTLSREFLTTKITGLTTNYKRLVDDIKYFWGFNVTYREYKPKQPPKAGTYKFYYMTTDTNKGKGYIRATLFNSFRKHGSKPSEIYPTGDYETYWWDEDNCHFYQMPGISRFSTNVNEYTYYGDTNSEEIRDYLTRYDGQDVHLEFIRKSRLSFNDPYNFIKRFTTCQTHPGPPPLPELPPRPPVEGYPPGTEPTPKGYTLHLFIDKVTMGTVTLCKPQLEIGTIATDWKPNPNDIDGGVREEVKIITDKVAKLEVKTGEIDALVKDNTTKITTLKDDTTKKITEIDNNIANIKVESGAIKTQVTKLEEKTTELDGQVQETARGLNEVKQTVTPDAIINTVQSTITQAKQDAITQAGADTDQKLQEYTLKDDFTSFTQDSKKFELAVKSAGVTNLLKNSRPRNHNLDYWYIGYNYHTMYIYYGGTDEATATENYNGEVFKSGIWFTMYAPTVPEGWLFLANNSIREYKFNTEREYTMDFLLYSEHPVSFYIQIANDNGAHQLFYSGNLTHEGGGYKRFTHTFRPTEQGDAPNFMLVVNNRRGERVNWFLPWANLYEGHKVTEQHLPDGRGLIDSRTTIDGNGIKCTFEDGTYAKMGREGFLYCTPHMNTPYKYINFTTRITGVRNGHWVEVQLPTIFRDKQININFIVQAWPGAVDSDAFSKFTQDALRNLFIEVGRWDPARHVLLVRPCMQKIGLKTLNMYGWDSATTTPGRPIGEGKVDIILLAQM